MACWVAWFSRSRRPRWALGGWLVLIVVFVCWVIATIGAILSPTVDLFGYAWLLNSFAYTITWGATIQVIMDLAGVAITCVVCTALLPASEEEIPGAPAAAAPAAVGGHGGFEKVTSPR